VLQRWSIPISAPVRAVLESPAGETPKPGDPVFAAAEVKIVARPADSLDAAAAVGRAAGYEVRLLGDSLEGEAREVGEAHGLMAIEALQRGRPVILLSGGELTVTLRSDAGAGGPNQEYALAFLCTTNGKVGITALAADTDGTDGGSGAATDPAGAFVDASTLTKAKGLGLIAANFLKTNSTSRFFERTGDLLVTGPTGTNVNDFRCIVVDKRNLDGQNF
jgi:hydroxypyruvate reductase